MSDVVLVCLIVFAVAVVGGLGLASLRGFAAWRAYRGFQRLTEPALADTALRIAGVETRTAAATAQLERLERARARLEESLATAAVLLRAAEEARAAVQTVRSVLPSK